VFSNQADLGGGNPLSFQIVAQRAYGARAERSDRHQQDRIHGVSFQKAGQAPGSLFHGGRVGGPHERIVELGHGSDGLFGGQFV
jgi:hypothetical protein